MGFNMVQKLHWIISYFFLLKQKNVVFLQKGVLKFIKNIECS